jgi:hypothetical protein
MIDERFSLQQFESRGLNSDDSNALARDLQTAIAEEVMGDLRALAERVATRLRELGHAVTESGSELDPSGMASVTFTDTSRGPDRSTHRLRFNLDLVVSAGFPGYRDDQYPEDEVSGLIMA